MTRDYIDISLSIFAQRNQQAALRAQLLGALNTLEQTDPSHATFTVAAHGVVNAYKAAKEAGAL